jgi:hypothetical protein
VGSGIPSGQVEFEGLSRASDAQGNRETGIGRRGPTLDCEMARPWPFAILVFWSQEL